MKTEDPTLHTVTLTLCSLCLDGGDVGECDVPGCALTIRRAGELSLRDNSAVELIDDWRFCERCFMRRARKVSVRSPMPLQLCLECFESDPTDGSWRT